LAEAEARAGGTHGNKGYDATMTAIEMARFGKPKNRPKKK
jgi:6,7-dimethyl-8-ribityllumazine synthase